MTKDFGPALDRELDHGSPPTAITADDIIHKGRAQTRSRAAYAGTASVIAVVLAAGLVFQIVGGATGGAPPDASGSPSASGVPDAPVQQPAFPLPTLGDDQEYEWSWPEGGPTPATERLARRWWEVLSTIDGAQPVRHDESEPDSAPIPAGPDDFADFVRREEILVEDLAPGPAIHVGPSIGYARPVYDAYNGFALQFDGAEAADRIELTYYPKGSFEVGPKTLDGGGDQAVDWRHLTTGCDDLSWEGQGTEGWTADFTCEYTDGPNGERVIAMEVVTTNPSKTNRHTYNRVVVYFPDGNAVRVTDHEPDASTYDEISTSDPGPSLSTDELTELVLAVGPVVIV